jgi:quinoprotein glucose dehydrogenase
MYEGDAGAAHFSALTQIDRSNVQDLQVAWTYPVDANDGEGFSPSIIDDIMYVAGTGTDLVALDAATGEELWTYPLPEGRGGDHGVLYWENEDRSDRRVYINRGDYLYAVDAASGEAIAPFGTNGRIDVRQGFERDTTTVRATPDSPGTVFEDLIILGSATGEDYGSAPGHIRAFDAVTGELGWVFHTIPHPGEEGYDTWEDPEAWKTAGGANAWGGMSVDVERGIVYVPLGSATYDFYGAERLGANLFANAVVALDARNGELIWYYQTTHHDLWDWDLTATPTLLTVQHEGETVDAVAVAAKTGFLFVFDRVTGEPLWEIEERPVPPSEVPGEEAWPTQPFPTRPEPFAVQEFFEDDVNPYLPQEEQDSLRRYVASMDNEGLYTPPSTNPTMQMPGNSGGANWGSTAADPADGLFYVLTKNLPTVLTLEPVQQGGLWSGADEEERGQFVYQQNCQLCHVANLEGNPPLIPTLVGVTERLTDEQIRGTIRQGQNTMPAFPDLSDEEVDDVIAYMEDPTSVSPSLDRSEQVQASSDDAPAQYKTGYGYFSASIGWAIKPPWVTMTAYDLNTGDQLWQTTVGEVEDLVERGITDSGARSLRGGPAVTEGGLLFVAVDETARAYDRDTGDEIWSYELPAGIEGIPSVYEVNGRQFVVFGAGSRGDSGENPAYVAFALPEE